MDVSPYINTYNINNPHHYVTMKPILLFSLLIFSSIAFIHAQDRITVEVKFIEVDSSEEPTADLQKLNTLKKVALIAAPTVIINSGQRVAVQASGPQNELGEQVSYVLSLTPTLTAIGVQYISGDMKSDHAVKGTFSKPEIITLKPTGLPADRKAFALVTFTKG